MKKIKKSHVFWLVRYWDKDSDIRLRSLHRNKLIAFFCPDQFRSLYPIGLRPNEKKKVKITIEVIE